MSNTTPLPPTFRNHASALLRLAAPLALSQLSEMAMGVTDTVLLGGLGVTAVAVGGLSSAFFFTTMIIFQAILGGAGVLLSHGRGATDYGQDGAADGRSVVSATVTLAFLVFIPCCTLLWCTHGLFTLLGEPTPVIHDGSHFVRILLSGLFPNLVLLGVLRVILPSLGAATLLSWTMPLMAVANGITNAALIQGLFGLPRLGLFGSAIASALTGWTITLLLLALSALHPRVRPLLKPKAFHLPLLGNLARLGIPMMMGAAAEILMFQITALRAGQLGTNSLAAHQVAINVTALLFMVSLAFGQATNMRVAYWRGAGQPTQARRATLIGLALVISWSMLTSILLLTWPDKIIGLYFRHTPPTPEALALMTILLKIAGVYQLVDGTQTVCNGALRGCGDTFTPMLIAFGCFGFIGVGGGGWLAFQQHMGVEGLWIGMASALAATSLGFALRLRKVLWA
nr:MATE family efflux transporter [uncultured Neokomagataea sp.]